MADRTVTTDLLGNDKMSPAFKSAGQTAQHEASKISKAGKMLGDGLKLGAVAAVGGLALLAKGAVDAASDAEQSVGATETVFKGAADTVIATSKDAAKQYGVSANSYRENANLIGSLFKNQGVAVDELAGKTEKMISTAADLSATFGGTTTEAVEALSSAFKGEFDPLERYGISLKQSTVNAEAMRLANVKSQGAFDKLSTSVQNAAKQQATSNLIASQSADAQGAFARETDTYAHKVQVLGAAWEDAKARIGSALLPTLSRLMGYLADKLPAAIESFAQGWNGLSLKSEGVEGAGAELKNLQQALGDVTAAFQEGDAVNAPKTFGDIVSNEINSVAELGTDWAERWNIDSNRIKGGWLKTKQAVTDMTGGSKAELSRLQARIDESNTKLARAEIAKLQTTIRRLQGKTVVTKADEAKIARSIQKVRELQRRIDSLQGNTIHVQTVVSQVGKAPGTYGKGLGVLVDGRAGGGPIKRGTPYVVGEEGPELIIPDSNGTVIPHGATKSAMRGAGPAGTTNIYVTVQAMAVDEIGVTRLVTRSLQSARQQGYQIPRDVFAAEGF